MCSVSDSDVGCDVERIRPIDLEIAKRYFFGTEYEAIADEEEDSRYDMFYRFWTLKESFMKATGLGFGIPLDSFRITLGKDIRVEQKVDDREYHLTEFSASDGYRYACCSVNGDFAPMEHADLGSIVRSLR